MKILYGVFFLVTVSHALGQIDDFQVILLDDAAGVLSFSQSQQLERDEASGLGFAPLPQSGIAEQDLQQTTRRSSANHPGIAGTDGVFELGDYVVLCFTPREDMYIRIMDTTPAGSTHQLYPSEDGGSVRVRAGYRYCAGDERSDINFYADEASGTGEGILWIDAAQRHEDLSAADGWDVPQSSLKFSRIPQRGTNTMQQGDVDTYRAWYRYEIVEAN